MVVRGLVLEPTGIKIKWDSKVYDANGARPEKIEGNDKINYNNGIELTVKGGVGLLANHWCCRN
jgi:hypothetical protein